MSAAPTPTCPASAVAALGAGVASVINVLDLGCVIIGGGLGVRLGEPYVRRISEAMQPHLFIDSRPPDVHLAALGDLGGAIGASLLLAPGQHALSGDAPSAQPREAVGGSAG